MNAAIARPNVQRPKFRARGRHRPGHMNKLEARYCQQLEIEKNIGKVLWWSFEAIKFKLADKTYLTPDFIVMTNDGYLEAHEVKGFWEDDARAKIKVAADKFPVKFVAVQWKSGAWVYEEI